MGIKSHYYRNIKYEAPDPIVEAIEHLEEEVEELQENVGTINTNLTTVTDRVTALENIVNRKFLLIGDSYGQGYSPDGMVTPWIEVFQNRNPNVLVYSKSKDGGAFGRSTSDERAFVQILESATVPTDIKPLITDIIVGGGANEYLYTNSEITTGINAFVNYAAEHYPNAKIWLFALGWNIASDPNRLSIFSIYKKVYETNQRVTFGGSGWLYLTDKRYMSSDGIHPNALGQQFLGHYVNQVIRGARLSDDGNNAALGLTLTGASYDGYGNMWRTGEYLMLRINKKETTVSIDGLTGGSFNVIASVPDDNYFITGVNASDETYRYTFASDLIVRTHVPDESPKYYHLSGDMVFARTSSGLQLWFRPMNIKSDGSGFLSLTDIDRVMFSANTFTFPIWRA